MIVIRAAVAILAYTAAALTVIAPVVEVIRIAETVRP